MNAATATAVKVFHPGKRVLPPEEIEAAEEFKAVILDYSVGKLAQSGRRTKEAAKAWKAGRALPSSLSLLQMADKASGIPKVRNWVLAKLNVSSDREFADPATLQAVIEALTFVATLPGADGDRARELLQVVNTGFRKPPG